jgi:DNA-binding transcriptional LysR family regulator
MATADQLLRRLRLRDLEVLRALAELRTMARTADRLGVTQSAISKTVAEMEDALGLPLVDRLPRGVELTEAGHILASRSVVVFDELREAVQAVQLLSDPAAGELRIGTTEAMGGTVAETIADLSAAHPGIRVSVDVSDTAALVDALRARTLDVVWTRWTPGIEAQDLRVHELFAAPLRIVAHRDHPAVQARSFEALAREGWTLSPPGSFLGRLVADVFATQGWAMPARPVITISIAMRLSLLATGRFLTVLPITMCRQPATADWLRALPIDLGPETGTIALLSLARRTEPAAMKAFRKHAAATAAALSHRS